MTFTTIQWQLVHKKGTKKNSKPLKYETEFESGVRESYKWLRFRLMQSVADASFGKLTAITLVFAPYICTWTLMTPN